jgi:epsilon-lactone hydrolase
VVTWETDRRPATLYTRIYVLGMRLFRDKQAFEGEQHTLRVARERQRRGDAPPGRWTRAVARVEKRSIAGMTAWSVRPRRRPPVARVFYVHGGGYVHPLTKDYWRLVRRLVAARIQVVVPAYPLAPDATIDDVLPRLCEVESATHASDEELPTMLMGDSAGGALVVSMALQARDQGRRPPVGVVALSPWLDATLDESEVRELEATDPMLAESGLRAAGRWWAGVRGPDDPLVSPVKADLHDLPPTEIFIGDRDILRPAVDTFAQRAEEVGLPLRVNEVTSMFHVWMTRAIPEGRRTRRQLADLVLRRSRRPDR